VYKTYAVLFARWPGLFVHVSGTRTVTSTATHRSFGTASMVTVFVSLAGAAFAFKRARPSVVAAPIAPKSAMRLSTRAFVAHVVVARIVVIVRARLIVSNANVARDRRRHRASGVERRRGRARERVRDVLVRGADVHVRGRRAHARGRDAMPRELVVRNRLFSGRVVRRDVHDSRRRRRRAGWYDGGV